jgi:hypothetical protein
MTEKKDKKTAPKNEDLSSAAKALRRSASKHRDAEDGATREMDAPDWHMLAAGMVPDALGEQLVNEGVITRHQLFIALSESYRSGISLEAALLMLEFVDQETLAKAKPKK